MEVGFFTHSARGPVLLRNRNHAELRSLRVELCAITASLHRLGVSAYMCHLMVPHPLDILAEYAKQITESHQHAISKDISLPLLHELIRLLTVRFTNSSGYG